MVPDGLWPSAFLLKEEGAIAEIANFVLESEL